MARKKDAYPVSETKAEVKKPDVKPATDTIVNEHHARDNVLGPSQRAEMRQSKDPAQRSLKVTAMRIAITAVLVAVVIIIVGGTSISKLPTLVWEVATLQRLPATAQDNEAAAVAFVLSLLPLFIVDATVCQYTCKDEGSRWFLLHALGNLVVAAMALPDFYWAAKHPQAAISVRYCADKPFPACSDWPTALIIAMHGYHVLRFKLSADDLFHHLVFVPIIGGIHFIYPWGTSGNILCFFISGLPGGLDYLMLSAVKAGKLSSYFEKRVNCSINTWIRSPGIITFCIVAICGWMNPTSETPPSDLMPWFLFWPTVLIIFFNAQYYAQRVIGNYYIRKAQDYTKRGIQKVDLHAS